MITTKSELAHGLSLIFQPQINQRLVLIVKNARKGHISIIAYLLCMSMLFCYCTDLRGANRQLTVNSQLSSPNSAACFWSVLCMYSVVLTYHVNNENEARS